MMNSYASHWAVLNQVASEVSGQVLNPLTLHDLPFPADPVWHHGGQEIDGRGALWDWLRGTRTRLSQGF